jgi:hypothetical protein
MLITHRHERLIEHENQALTVDDLRRLNVGKQALCESTRGSVTFSGGGARHVGRDRGYGVSGVFWGLVVFIRCMGK